MTLIKKTILLVCIVLAIVVVFEVIRTKSNPLTQSDDQLRSHFLEQTPLGTSKDDVIHYIVSKKGWYIEYIDEDNGFTHQRKKPRETVGDKHIRVYLGEYRAISNLYFTADVTAFYGFNENSELIDIWVRTVIDSL